MTRRPPVPFYVEDRCGTLKEVFKGAAHLLATRMTGHPLRAEYQRLLERGLKPNLAKVTMVRRISAAVLAMWKLARAKTTASSVSRHRSGRDSRYGHLAADVRRDVGTDIRETARTGGGSATFYPAQRKGFTARTVPYILSCWKSSESISSRP